MNKEKTAQKSPSLSPPDKNIKYEYILAVVIALRGSSFLFNKIMIQRMGNFNVMCLRFSIAFIILALIFAKRLLCADRSSIIAGMTIGAAYFITMGVELTALKIADASMVSMIENSAALAVPALEFVLFRKKPEKAVLISAFVAVAGIVLLRISGSDFSAGFTRALLALLCNSIAIITAARMSRRASDTFAAGIFQVGTIAVLAAAAAFIDGSPRLPRGGFEWGMTAGLVFIGTVIGFTFVPVCSAHVSAEKAGLFSVLSPATATILSIVFLKERPTATGAAGLVLILFSLALPNIIRAVKAKKDGESRPGR